MNKTIAIIIILAFLGLMGHYMYLIHENKTLTTQVSDQAINLKSINAGVQKYKTKYDEVYARVIDTRYSLAELRNSKDSTITQLLNRLHLAGVKLKDINAIAVSNNIMTRDTTIIYQKADPLRKTFDFSKRPHIVNTVAITDTTATNKLIVTDVLTSFTKVEKETINPRRKFFLWRLFQKKQLVSYTDINHTNPYVDVTAHQQITIMDTDGTPKSKSK